MNRIWLDRSGRRYRQVRTATYYSVDERSAATHPLAKCASPAVIQSALLADDQVEFDLAYDRALNEAKASKDLTELFTILDRWRRLAALQSDPEEFRRVARRAAELHAGRPRPEDEPLSVTRAHTGIWPVYVVHADEEVRLALEQLPANVTLVAVYATRATLDPS